MRIADYAGTIQSSAKIQQPANATHQQQVQAPLIANALAAAQAAQHATQVNQSDKTEGRTIQDGKQNNQPKNRKKGKSAPGVESPYPSPTNVIDGDHIDILA